MVENKWKNIWKVNVTELGKFTQDDKPLEKLKNVIKVLTMLSETKQSNKLNNSRLLNLVQSKNILTLKINSKNYT